MTDDVLLDDLSPAELAAWLDLVGDDGVLDLFAGPGGWDEALRILSPAVHDRTLGLEWDAAACATRRAAGHRTLRADVAAFPVETLLGRVEGLIGSPPCQAFSLAGRGAGRRAVEALLAHVAACLDGWIDPPEALCTEDVRADLTLQPLRWALALRPRWVALEQVPGVLPLWEATAEVLERHGYSTWTGKLCAADYGVPQTRTRAVLIARRDGIPATPPAPTHYDARGGRLSLFDDLQPWVSMAEALGWGEGYVLDPPHGDRGFDRTQPRDVETEPAVTLAFGHHAAGWTFSRPATTIIGSSTAVAAPGHRCMSDDCCGKGPRRHFDGNPVDATHWGHERPATTVVGSFRPDVIAAPGWRNAGDGPRQDAPGSVRITVQQAAVLQSFRADYPWQGSRTKQFQQVGNAVPPVLAAAVLRDLVA